MLEAVFFHPQNRMGRQSRRKRERRSQSLTGEVRLGFRWPAPQPISLGPPGVTKAERYLARLCQNTFLSLWSYPNVFHAQKTRHGVIGHEVCDLLVVFENDVLIFSDKDCAFGSSGDLDLDWSRWYRRAVAKSAHQLFGAERLVRSGEQLFLDPKLASPFPIEMPSPDRMSVHRILVAHGVADSCKKHCGGNGTLMLVPEIVGDRHIAPEDEGGIPFAVGRVNASKGFVHILDEAALTLLLTTLDTVADLVAYLKKKEAFVLSGKLKIAAGEEALLGRYLADLDADGTHGFEEPGDAVGLDESLWHRWLKSGERKRKKQADEVSYLWDFLIERFTQHFRAGLAPHSTAADLATFEKAIRFYAREDRTRRRMLADGVLDMLKKTDVKMRRIRVVLPSRPGDPHWVFLLMPQPSDIDDETYRAARRLHLQDCALVVKLQNPDATDIVGFATDSGYERELRSEDAMYFDGRTWTDTMAAEARRVKESGKILMAPDVLRATTFEYPSA